MKASTLPRPFRPAHLALSTLALLALAACNEDTAPSAEPAGAAARTDSHEARDPAPAPASPATQAETADDTASAQPERESASEDEGPAKKAPEAEAAALEIKRLVVTSKIEDREPADVDDLTAGDGPVYAFVELVNDAAREAGIVITFEHESGTKVGHIELPVPGESPRWRTWGRTQMIRKGGKWNAVVRDKGGQELGRQPFEVTPPA